MTIPAAVMIEMATLGLNPEQASRVAAMMSAVETATKAEAEAGIETSRKKARDRWHTWDQKRRSNVAQRLQTLANNRQQLARAEDRNSNLEIEPQGKKETPKRADGAFEVWYATYPHKVQRGAAEKAFPKALELAGSVEALVAGVQRYVASKPPDRPFQNPATWLNGKGWLDQPAAMPAARAGPPGRAPTAQELLRTRRESFANDEPPPNGPYLIVAR